jgi:hypothetical protein
MALMRCYGCGRFGSTLRACKVCGHTSPTEHYHFTDPEREQSEGEDRVRLIVDPWTRHLRAEPPEGVVVHAHPYTPTITGHRHWWLRLLEEEKQ